METVLNISLIITSVMLIVLVVLQSRGAGLGGLTGGGGDAGSIFTARRGIEKVMFYLTIIFSVLFFILAITSVLVN